MIESDDDFRTARKRFVRQTFGLLIGSTRHFPEATADWPLTSCQSRGQRTTDNGERNTLDQSNKSAMIPSPLTDLGSFQGFRSPVSARSVSFRIGFLSSFREMGFGVVHFAPLGGSEPVLNFALMPIGVGRQGTRRSSRWIDTVACWPADVWSRSWGSS
jgi:hypothetical protein